MPSTAVVLDGFTGCHKSGYERTCMSISQNIIRSCDYDISWAECKSIVSANFFSQLVF